eukprot:CAMPEP_0197662624 /NCGR_PEP_ID=MMETSP1338-20131121/54164_1 /TAXON_ID=43686 ORGANISM="Pelagodinium beii, Strain RCC1491" /NCGR_SAMPLE_ID=MMETSP1338 /ASSEMBLY_ACC=CAM_ASM_000754 /LENGTH=326 /DNA_ID=CAMNT_0043240553 /DNA_START=53 /DNA_END=1033 /DNA_ORIENTATION=+
MNESARIAMRHKVGSVGNLLGNRSPPAKKDYKLDNVKKLRTMSREVRRERQESEKPPEPEFKLRQFESIPSRLHQTPKRMTAISPGWIADTSTPGPRPRSASSSAMSPSKGKPPASGQSPWARAPLRPCNEPIYRPQSAGAGKGSWPSATAASRPLAFSPPTRAPPTEVADEPSFGRPRRLFGEEGERLARPGSSKRAGSVELKENQNPGWWPAKGSATDWKPRPPSRTASSGNLRTPLSSPFAADGDSDEPAVPHGYRSVSEEERLQTLSELRTKLRELNDRYMRLPLKIETEGHRQQQQALREKIAQTERAEMLFSRPKVLVEL